MKKQIISTELAPSAIGPYSQAVRVGNTVYISGQIPLDPKTMLLIEGDFKRQAEQVLKNLDAIAQAAGASLDDSVKLTVYLTNLADFSVLNDMMNTVFSEPFPARATVQVSELPKGAALEIDAVLSIDV